MAEVITFVGLDVHKVSFASATRLVLAATHCNAGSRGRERYAWWWRRR